MQTRVGGSLVGNSTSERSLLYESATSSIYVCVCVCVIITCRYIAQLEHSYTDTACVVE